MSKLPLYILSLLILLASCSNYETYADKKKKEQSAIERFIAAQGIQVISEATFEAQQQTTDLAQNQFVKFSRNGVYMQIVRKGSGEPLPDNKTSGVICRFMEQNLLTDSVLAFNDHYGTKNGAFWDASPYFEKMSVTRYGKNFEASFVQGTGVMQTYYGSTSVPGGWLIPFNYINVGFPVTDGVDSETAKVRLIVPHSQGTANASSSVYPCYYVITYQKDN